MQQAALEREPLDEPVYYSEDRPHSYLRMDSTCFYPAARTKQTQLSEDLNDSTQTTQLNEGLRDPKQTQRNSTLHDPWAELDGLPTAPFDLKTPTQPPETATHRVNQPVAFKSQQTGAASQHNEGLRDPKQTQRNSTLHDPWAELDGLPTAPSSLKTPTQPPETATHRVNQPVAFKSQQTGAASQQDIDVPPAKEPEPDTQADESWGGSRDVSNGWDSTSARVPSQRQPKDTKEPAERVPAKQHAALGWDALAEESSPPVPMQAKKASMEPKSGYEDAILEISAAEAKKVHKELPSSKTLSTKQKALESQPEVGTLFHAPFDFLSLLLRDVGAISANSTLNHLVLPASLCLTPALL